VFLLKRGHNNSFERYRSFIEDEGSCNERSNCRDQRLLARGHSSTVQVRYGAKARR